MACKECGGGTFFAKGKANSLGLCDSCYDMTARLQKKEETLQEEENKLQEEEIILQRAIDSGKYSHLTSKQIDRLSQHIVLTTAFTVARREIDYEIEVISAECAFGMNIFKDLFTAVRDVVGGRSKAAQDVMRDSRKTALLELKREALMVGADAVIGIDLDYAEFQGGGFGGGGKVVMLIANGTAVKLID